MTDVKLINTIRFLCIVILRWRLFFRYGFPSATRKTQIADDQTHYNQKKYRKYSSNCFHLHLPSFFLNDLISALIA